jgi:hypothetical protein
VLISHHGKGTGQSERCDHVVINRMKKHGKTKVGIIEMMNTQNRYLDSSMLRSKVSCLIGTRRYISGYIAPAPPPTNA